MDDTSSGVNIVSTHCKEIQRILIIEDSVSLANHLKEKIEKNNGIGCDIALTESEGKILVEKNSYELVISDLHLPDSDGNFIAWLIRKDMKIVIMTSADEVDVREKLVKLPIVDYIPKTDQKSLVNYICETIQRLQQNKDSLVAVCDDSKVARRHVCNILINQNISFVELNDGKEVLEFISENHHSIDLLISDYEMPDMNGLDLTRKLRIENGHFELPILILSGNSNSTDIANMLKSGANEYVHKPISNEEFLVRMNRLLDHSRLHFQNQKLTQELEVMAMRDNLTGLYNRNYFDGHFKQILAQNKRDKSSYAIIMLDIDHFKFFNDTYGHEMGDTVLKEVATVLMNSARPMDIICRWGGEEFVMLLPNTKLLGAANVAERIRSNVEKIKLAIPLQNDPVSITISGGVTISDSEDIQSVINDADEKLYVAKDSGRNKMVLAK